MQLMNSCMYAWYEFKNYVLVPTWGTRKLNKLLRLEFIIFQRVFTGLSKLTRMQQPKMEEMVWIDMIQYASHGLF